MKLAALFGAVVVVAAATAAWVSNSAARTDTIRTYLATCADSVYQAPAAQPPSTYAALRLGPVIFNHLAARTRLDVSPPTDRERFYNVASFFNVFTSARRGVTIRLLGGDASARLSAGRVRAAQAARAIRFLLCRDPGTKAPLITQYGISFLLRRPGCFTVEVQPVGTSKRFRATIPFRVSHC